MTKHDQLAAHQAETGRIIQELLEDGSDPDALYTIEHHLAATDFAALEKLVVEAFRLGYEITEPEELETESGEMIICCDVISEVALRAELIDQQIEQLLTLAEKYRVDYEGWGTYFEDPDGDDTWSEDDDEPVLH